MRQVLPPGSIEPVALEPASEPELWACDLLAVGNLKEPEVRWNSLAKTDVILASRVNDDSQEVLLVVLVTITTL